MKVCHRAEVSLWFEQNKVHFSFSPFELNTKHNFGTLVNGNLQNITSDHTYSAEPSNCGENDNFYDLDYSEIYDCSGDWEKKHIRRLIYVMDCFRISHEAYHEL